MKKEEIQGMIKDIVDSKAFKEGLDREIEELVNEVVDAKHDDWKREQLGTFGLPKIILSTALKELSYHYRTLSEIHLERYDWLLKKHQK